MTKWMSVKVGRDETIYINVDNIVKISGSLGQTTLHYVNGERELLSNQQAAGILGAVLNSWATTSRGQREA
jgi:hypothetical protein